MTPSTHFPDLNRLSVLTATIVLAYALARVLDLPARVFSTTVFGSPLNIAIDGPFVVLVIVAAMISAGAEDLLRSHPYFIEHPQERALPHWILPGLTALVLAATLNSLPDKRLWWLGLGLSVLALLAVLITEYLVADPQDARHDVAMLALVALTYALALTLFALLLRLGYRSVISAPLCGLAGSLMTIRLYTLRTIPLRRALPYALLVGLLCTETFWAVSYWRVTPGAAALVLMIPFYVSQSATQQHLTIGLSPRSWVEYLTVTVAGLGLALSYAFLWGH